LSALDSKGVALSIGDTVQADDPAVLELGFEAVVVAIEPDTGTVWVRFGDTGRPREIWSTKLTFVSGERPPTYTIPPFDTLMHSDRGFMSFGPYLGLAARDALIERGLWRGDERRPHLQAEVVLARLRDMETISRYMREAITRWTADINPIAADEPVKTMGMFEGPMGVINKPEVSQGTIKKSWRGEGKNFID
jgi:hypothetical protein